MIVLLAGGGDGIGSIFLKRRQTFVAKQRSSGYHSRKSMPREGIGVMASVKSKPKKKAAAAARAEEKPARLADYLLARAPAEDVAAYDVADLERAGELASRAVAGHKKG
ncbi:MAG: hypothetical protein E5W55_30985, partial [Mesorhizobium sp.]